MSIAVNGEGPHMTVAIAPSVLSSDFSRLREEAKELLGFGAEWLHLDIMDGHFVDNLTFGHDLVRCLRPHSTALFDCHLMVEDPAKFVDKFASAGANQILFHVEKPGLDQAPAVLKQIKDHGVRAGLVIKPSTPLTEEILSFVEANRALIDCILPMTVEPGKSGQSFMHDQMDKFRTLRKRFPDLDLEADGGVNIKTIGEVADAGANIVVAGSGIFKASNREFAIQTMKARIHQALGQSDAQAVAEKRAQQAVA